MHMYIHKYHVSLQVMICKDGSAEKDRTICLVFILSLPASLVAVLRKQFLESRDHPHRLRHKYRTDYSTISGAVVSYTILRSRKIHRVNEDPRISSFAIIQSLIRFLRISFCQIYSNFLFNIYHLIIYKQRFNYMYNISLLFKLYTFNSYINFYTLSDNILNILRNILV